MPNMLSFLFSYAPRSLRLPELEQKISFLDRHQVSDQGYRRTVCMIGQDFFRNRRDKKIPAS